MVTIVVFLLGFIFIALAAKQIGEYVTHARLPLITGYLFAGAIAGPFILGLIPPEATRKLVVVDEIALAFIAFAAGSELYLKDLRSRYRSIFFVTSGLVLVTYLSGTAVVFFLSDLIPFMKGLPASTRLAIAMMAGAIMVARSPSSAIAIVNELRARGPYTKTALGVTVVMDVVVITLFAISSAIALALIKTGGIDPIFALTLSIELVVPIVAGILLGKILTLLMRLRLHERPKTLLVLGTGFAVYPACRAFRGLTHDLMGHEVHLEPLLICMIGGFVVANYSRFRDEFLELLHIVGPAVYVAFFTLTGASLALDTLVVVWPITLTLFGVRLTAIAIGSYSGGRIAGDPPEHNRMGWMAYITQAGVGLGLAKQVAVTYPAFGDQFATLIISVIVLNQIVGPPFFKSAIRRAGEAHLPGVARPDEILDALILGIDDQSIALGRQLKANGWSVVMADTDASQVERLAAEDVDARHIEQIDEGNLGGLLTSATDALVATLEDQENHAACVIAREKFGIKRLIVRLNDHAWADRFKELDALTVDPARAMVNLLDQFVRAPASTSMLLHRDPDHSIVQVPVTDPDLDRMPLRELRLPTGVLVLGISREGHSIVPHGHTILHLGDEVTLVGHPKSLAEVANRWGFSL